MAKLESVNWSVPTPSPPPEVETITVSITPKEYLYILAVTGQIPLSLHMESASEKGSIRSFWHRWLDVGTEAGIVSSDLYYRGELVKFVDAWRLFFSKRLNIRSEG